MRLQRWSILRVNSTVSGDLLITCIVVGDKKKTNKGSSLQTFKRKTNFYF